MKKNLKIIITSILFIALGLFVFSQFEDRGHKVILSDRQVVVIDTEKWNVLENTQDNAFNFERLEKLDSDVFKQVVTIYDQSLSESKKATLIQLGSNEGSSDAYLADFFRVHDDGITAQIIYDHGAYYVMSRQTYYDVSGVNPESSDEDFITSIGFHAENIQSTIYTLKNIFSVQI